MLELCRGRAHGALRAGLDLSLVLFHPADSDQCKYGKNRVEADAKRLQTKEEELMKRKQDIRTHLTQLKKERRDLRTAVEAAAGERRPARCRGPRRSRG